MDKAKIDDGGSAYLYTAINKGLTKREWFAGMALIGAMSDSLLHFDREGYASWAYQQADAMIAAGKKGEN